MKEEMETNREQERAFPPPPGEPADEADVYFAASNSAEGFRNYYPACFGPDSGVDRLFIIKGGPGTGKSRFMREAARYAGERGYQIVCYACSSDPSSLDGIKLWKDGRPCIGLLDGTPPHTMEPSCPGAREELIHLGQFWDSSVLFARREWIQAQMQAKKEAYGRAFRCLAACGELKRAAESLIRPALFQDRLTSAAVRLLRTQPMGRSFRPVPALRRAVGMTGDCCLHTFEKNCSSLVVVTSDDPTAFFLRTLLSEAGRRHLTVLVSWDPVYPDTPDGLFFPDTGFCVLSGEARPRKDCPTRTLSLRRMIDRAHVPEADVRELQAEETRLLCLAKRLLRPASEAHFALEALYAEAMDFPAKEAFTLSFLRSTFP